MSAKNVGVVPISSEDGSEEIIHIIDPSRTIPDPDGPPTLWKNPNEKVYSLCGLGPEDNWQEGKMPIWETAPNCPECLAIAQGPSR